MNPSSGVVTRILQGLVYLEEYRFSIVTASLHRAAYITFFCTQQQLPDH
jgi:hypothetical protein